MYDINYEDERFKEVETDRKEALTENEQMYGGMISDADKYYQAQIDASKQWATEQQKLQQEKTDFAIEKIEQQKAQATKDYKKEQSGAYVDWQKESNRYGANAEQMASQGLANTGYAESSQVSLYTAYQNRVATAREAHSIIIMNYNNGIKDAQLQNNSALAEIRYKALQQQLELSLQGFQYKNTLLEAKANQKAQIENRFDNKYQAVLDQMNKENALAEEVRQYNQNYQLELDKMKQDQAQFDAQMAARSSGGSGGSGGGSGSGGSSGGSGGGNSGQLSGNNSSNKKNVEDTLSLKNFNDTHIKVKSVTMGAGEKFGLSNDSKIYEKNGNYYALEGDNLVNVGILKPQIKMMQNFIPQTK